MRRLANLVGMVAERFLAYPADPWRQDGPQSRSKAPWRHDPPTFGDGERATLTKRIMDP